MRRMRVVFWLVVALQVMALLGFAGAREYSLRTGQEIILETVPVDPVDLFRGDYVVLRYEISTLSGPFDPGDTVYVRLAEHDGAWTAGGVTGSPPTQDGPFIRGRVTRVLSGGAARGIEVEYGIESYFVPEGTGERIERAVGELKVKVAVDGSGNAVIEELLIDD